MGRRLLCLDLDGTLVDDHGNLGRASFEALDRLRRQGHIISFVSGRSQADMALCGHMCQCADFMLLNNGGTLLDLAGSEVIFRETVETDIARTLAAYCLEQGFQLYAVMGKQYAVTRMTPGAIDYARSIGVQPALLTSPLQLPPASVEHLIAVGCEDRVSAFIQENAFPLQCVVSEPGCCDILPLTGGKWPGICRLISRLGLSSADVLAMGNYSNDIDMLRKAGTGVAVANALPPVKAAADYVTKRTNNEDPIVEVARVFFGL